MKPNRSAPWDMLAKSGLLSQRLRLPTACIAFVLRRRRFHSARGQFRLKAAGAPTQCLWFREICLWRVKPEDWWDGVPGLMALYPLCRHGKTPHDAVRHAADAIKQSVTVEADREDQLFLLNIFGDLAYPRLDVERIIRSDIMIRESRIVRRIRREAEVERLRSVLLKVIRKQFGREVATELTASVQAVDDLESLEGLFDRTLDGISLRELRSALPAQPG